MNVRRWVAAACVTLVVGWGTAVLCKGDETPVADPDAFEKGLAKVAALYERDRAKSGLQALGALLEEHARGPREE